MSASGKRARREVTNNKFHAASLPPRLCRYDNSFVDLGVTDFQIVIILFLFNPLSRVVSVSRKKGYFDAVRQPNYWSEQINKS
jgi:hypothetical protein